MRVNKFFREGAGKYVLIGVTAVALVGLIVLNLLLTHIGANELLYIDLTEEGFYTVSDAMVEHTQFINKLETPNQKVKITFCADPDTLIMTERVRMPYFLALGLQQLYPERIEVETVNVIYNPTAVSKYKANSLTQIESDDIIFSYGERYRIIGADNMWIANSSTGELYSFNGEYKMATAIMSVTAKERPVAYFSIGHGETYYDTARPDRVENNDAEALYDLLLDRGLEVKTLDLRTEDIPDDCVLLVINNPREDFVSGELSDGNAIGFISQTEKIDRYLVREQGAVMVSKDPMLELHNFDLFLYEWGFDIPKAIVEDREYYMSDTEGYNKIIGIYDTDPESYGMAIYEDFAALPSAPSMIFKNTGFVECAYGQAGSVNEPGTVTVNRHYAPFFYSSTVANALDGANQNYHNAAIQGAMDIAAVTTRMEIDQDTAKYKYSYIFCAPSAEAFSNELLGNGSYANFDIMASLIQNMSRIDEYASIELGGTSFNSDNFGGKPFLNTGMSEEPIFDINDEGEEEMIVEGLTAGKKTVYTILIAIAPVTLAVLGIVVKVKRKNK